MRPPRFEIGQRVVHHQRIGVVGAVFPDEAGAWRYYVDRRDGRWSAPEWALTEVQ